MMIMTKGEALSLLNILLDEALRIEEKSLEEKQLILALELAMNALECPVVFTSCAGCVDSGSCKNKGQGGVCDSFKLYDDETGEAKPRVMTAILNAITGRRPPRKFDERMSERSKERNNTPLSDEAYARMVDTANKISDPEVRSKVLAVAKRRHDLNKKED